MADFSTPSTPDSTKPVAWPPIWLVQRWTAAWNTVRYPSLHRDAFLLMAGTGVTSLVGFLYWKLATMAYHPAYVGIAAAALSSANFLASMAHLGLTIGVMRFMPEASSSAKATLVTFVYLISTSVGVISTSIFLGGRQWWVPNLIPTQTAPLLYMATFFALVLTLAYRNVHASVLQAERRIPMLFGRNVGMSLAQLILILVLPLSLGPLSIVASLLIPNALAAILMFWIISHIISIPGVPTRLQMIPFGSVLSYSLGNLLFNLLWFFPTFFFPLLTLNLLGPTANARLAITWRINSFVLIIPNSIAVALLIDGSYKEERLASQARLAILTDLVILTPVVLTIMMLAPFILSIFGVDYAREATGLLRLLAFASLPTSVTSVYLTIKRVRKQILSLNLLTLVLSGLVMVSSIVLITRLGLIGIGWGWLFSQSIFAVMVIGLFWRQQRSKD